MRKPERLISCSKCPAKAVSTAYGEPLCAFHTQGTREQPEAPITPGSFRTRQQAFELGAGSATQQVLIPSVPLDEMPTFLNVADTGSYSAEFGKVLWESERRDLANRIEADRLSRMGDHRAVDPRDIANWGDNESK
jgi:hypothetical protein